METKIKPATPLPWHAEASSNCWRAVGSAQGSPAVIGNWANDPSKSDADIMFAIHAANAYPRLVEALQLACNEEELTSDGDPPQWCRRAMELLRDLGEIE